MEQSSVLSPFPVGVLLISSWISKPNTGQYPTMDTNSLSYAIVHCGMWERLTFYYNLFVCHQLPMISLKLCSSFALSGGIGLFTLLITLYSTFYTDGMQGIQMTSIAPRGGSNYGNKSLLKQIFPGDAYNIRAFAGSSQRCNLLKMKNINILNFWVNSNRF